MARDVKGFIEEYNQKYENDDKFTVSDIMQLQEITEKNDEYIFNLISNCLDYGFMMGYKTRAIEYSANINREELLNIMEKVGVVLNTIESLHESALMYDKDGLLKIGEKARNINTEWEIMRKWIDKHYNVIACMLEQSAIITNDVFQVLNEWELQAQHEEVRSEADAKED